MGGKLGYVAPLGGGRAKETCVLGVLGPAVKEVDAKYDEFTDVAGLAKPSEYDGGGGFRSGAFAGGGFAGGGKLDGEIARKLELDSGR
jgi:hypothetical protein